MFLCVDMEGGRPKGVGLVKEVRSCLTLKPLPGVWARQGAVSLLEIQVRSSAEFSEGPLSFSSPYEVGHWPGGAIAPERTARPSGPLRERAVASTHAAAAALLLGHSWLCSILCLPPSLGFWGLTLLIGPWPSLHFSSWARVAEH